MSDSESIRVGEVTAEGAWLWLSLDALIDAERAAVVAEDVRVLGMAAAPERIATCSELNALCRAFDEATRGVLVKRLATDREFRGEVLQVFEGMVGRDNDPDWGRFYVQLAGIVAGFDMQEEEAEEAQASTQPPATPTAGGIAKQILASLGPRQRPVAKRSEFDRLIELKGEALKRAGRDPAKLHIAGAIQRRRTIRTVTRYLRDLEGDAERTAEWAVARELMEGLWHLLD